MATLKKTQNSQQDDLVIPAGMAFDSRMCSDGIEFLDKLPAATVPVAFFDPQYRGILDKMAYGNEGKNRGQGRNSLTQMDDGIIISFMQGLDRVIKLSGHVFLWVDKFHLCTGIGHWLTGLRLEIVDLMVSDKQRIGMGYRTRRTCEYVVILQKSPRRAKGIWKKNKISDVWAEKVLRSKGIHPKPVKLKACQNEGRRFLSCDING